MQLGNGDDIQRTPINTTLRVALPAIFNTAQTQAVVEVMYTYRIKLQQTYITTPHINPTKQRYQ